MCKLYIVSDDEDEEEEEEEEEEGKKGEDVKGDIDKVGDSLAAADIKD
jgi:hypothetical protein